MKLFTENIIILWLFCICSISSSASPAKLHVSLPPGRWTVDSAFSGGGRVFTTYKETSSDVVRHVVIMERTVQLEEQNLKDIFWGPVITDYEEIKEDIDVVVPEQQIGERSFELRFVDERDGRGELHILHCIRQLGEWYMVYCFSTDLSDRDFFSQLEIAIAGVDTPGGMLPDIGGREANISEEWPPMQLDSNLGAEEAAASPAVTLRFPPGEWIADAQFVHGAYFHTSYREVGGAARRRIRVSPIILSMDVRTAITSALSIHLDDYAAKKDLLVVEERETPGGKRMVVVRYRGVMRGQDSVVVIYLVEAPGGWIVVECVSRDPDDQQYFDQLLIDVK